MARAIERTPAGQILAAQFVNWKVWERVTLKVINGPLAPVHCYRKWVSPLRGPAHVHGVGRHPPALSALALDSFRHQLFSILTAHPFSGHRLQ